MTSRLKITRVAKAAKKHNCAVYLKTGPHPPGVMIAESELEEGVGEWVKSVKRLRYKDFQLLRVEEVGQEEGRLRVEKGSVREFESMKGLARALEECGVIGWWQGVMGFKKEG